jgi:CheY-like chemotaxis protein
MPFSSNARDAQSAGDDGLNAPAGGLRVLVVEDNTDGREMLVTLLDTLGYAVDAAEDGPQAVEVAARFDPQVVLLDLGLPVFDGVEVCRRLRADDRHAHAFIIALTGWGAARDRQRTTEAGFDAHLTKPAEPQLLEETLAQYAAAWPRRLAAVAG